MRVWFRKIHCPSSLCFFSKPPQQLYTPPPLAAAASASAAVVDHLPGEKEKQEQPVVVVDGEKVDGTKLGSEIVLKSCVKRKVVNAQGADADADAEPRKKAVQWMDVAGKSLVHVKEFEPSESEDTDSESEHNRGCTCAII